MDDTLSILHLGGGYLPPALRSLGHRVLHAGPTPGADLLIPHPTLAERLLERVHAAGFTPDALIYEDNGNLPQFIGLERLPLPSVFYSIDTFCNPWHIPYGNAFDAVFAAQQPYTDVFWCEAKIRAEWLPLFWTRALAEEDPATWLLRDLPVSFVGSPDPANIPSRKPFFAAFKRVHPLFQKQGDFVPVFARSRIVLNQTAASELNFRCFEAPACGAALLMEDCPEFDELFAPGVNCLPPYRRGDARHAAAIAREWLAKPEQLAEVALAGHKLMQERHSATARAAALVERLRALRAEEAPARRLTELSHRAKLLSSAYAILVMELNKPTLAHHKVLYRDLFYAMMNP